MTLTWLTLLPPVLAIVIAIWKKEVILALLLALFTSELLQQMFHPGLGFTGSLERVVAVFTDAGNARILLFCLLVGALLAYIRDSGGVSAFVRWVNAKKFADSQRKVGLLATLTGIVIFIETNMSVLTSGIVSQSLFDKYKMSRARLAYIIDSTSAPVSILVMFNAWGAYVLGLLEGYGLENTTSVLIGSIPLNFYAWIALGLVFYTVLTTRVHGPMKASEAALKDIEVEQDDEEGKIRYMTLPLAVMIFGILALMWLTGDGNIVNGSGSRSVLWAVGLALLCGYFLLRFDGKYTHQQLVDKAFTGMSGLLPLVTVVLLAFALGASLRSLGTGTFVAGMLGEYLPAWSIAALIFVTAGVISFTTGTSWGTFGLLIPIALPLAETFSIPPELLVSAVLGGGVFGDHASPISDTTIISSLASGCEVIEHVKTQLPYALVGGGLSIILYLIYGMTL